MAEKTAKAPNYTEAMTETLHAMYAELGNTGIEAIANKLGKTPRSVISKLVRDGIYVAPEKKASTRKDNDPSKKELLNTLDKAGFSPDGLENATKEALSRVIALVHLNQAH